MSKNNNMNPGQYYDGDRNHQGEGIVQEDHKEKLKEAEKRQGKEGEKNFIPGEAPAGEKKKSDR
ncbi:MAG: hypothetical protein JJE51_08400 [Thermoanaerobaculia bacterium]|nr:hypothetical protein [Thermoanaerobaculia bacterium]